VLLALSLLLAACGGAIPVPAGIVVGAVATATVPAIHLPTYAPGASPSATTPGDRPTSTPTAFEAQTKTPPPGTATATAASTRRPGSGSAPGPTATVPAAIGPAPDTSAYGVAATFGLEGDKAAYRPGEHVWFDFTLTNLKPLPLTYGAVGVILPDGSFHSSLSGSSLSANERLSWRDWVSFSASGDQPLVLSMCISPVDVCRTGGTWVNLSAPVFVKIN
jgi:hypothetical protein